MGQHLSDAPREIASLILTLEFMEHVGVMMILVFVLHLCSKFEVRMPSHSEDMTLSAVTALIILVTLTFVLLTSK